MDELGRVNEPEILIGVRFRINVALGPNEPDIPVDVNIPLLSKDDTLVLKLELDATKAPVISVDIWAELESKVLDVKPASVNVTLALKDELGE